MINITLAAGLLQRNPQSFTGTGHVSLLLRKWHPAATKWRMQWRKPKTGAGRRCSAHLCPRDSKLSSVWRKQEQTLVNSSGGLTATLAKGLQRPIHVPILDSGGAWEGPRGRNHGRKVSWKGTAP